MRWPALALALVALLAGGWAWSRDGGAQPATGTVQGVQVTDTNVAPGTRGNVQVWSAPFVTRAQTWAAYWSYYCLMPGITRWRMRLLLVRGASSAPQLLYAADSRRGPVSYTQIFTEHGPGTYRFIVDGTYGCVWSLRAPPVANSPGLALEE